jgi:hypothetical protein
MFIPDSGSDFFPSRILIKEFKYFNTKKTKKMVSNSNFLSSKKYYQGCSSRIPDPDADFLPIPYPGSRGQKGTRSRIPDPDPQHWTKVGYRTLLTLFIAGGGRKSATYKYGYIPEHDSTFGTLTRVPKG